MCDKEHNFVADAHNWEKRVKGEMEIARVRSNFFQLVLAFQYGMIAFD